MHKQDNLENQLKIDGSKAFIHAPAVREFSKRVKDVL
jgi:hypothetical protein